MERLESLESLERVERMGRLEVPRRVRQLPVRAGSRARA